jgi:hypothetical protein
LTNPETVVEWDVLPVVVNELLIAANDVPAVVENLHVALSSVVSASVACEVPAESVPEGDPLLRTGGVVSGPDTLTS